MRGPNEAGTQPVELGPEDRHQPAGRVFALVLDTLLAEFRRHEPAVLAGDDADALHDYRVALRRTRSILKAGARVYPPEELELLAALTTGLAAATSPVRDLDVLLDALDGYAEPLAEELHDGVDLLRTELGRRRATAHAELVARIRGDSHPVLVRRWQVMASVHRLGGSEPGPDALRPTGEVTDELIAGAYRRVVDKGGKRLASDDRARWHDVRKRLKRLRYLVAAFAPLYPEGAFEPMLDELSTLQDRFGALQDHVVHADLLESVGTDLGGRAALAAGALSDVLHHRVRKDLRKCRKRFDRLESKPVRRAMRRTLAGD